MPALTDIPGFTREETAGLLARAALALDSGGTNPEAKAVLPGELEIRQRLVDDFRAEFPTDDEQEFKARVLDWLDQETERLSPPSDEGAALERLSADAALPSDVYSIDYDQAFVASLAETGFDDRALVAGAVHSPDYEEHFGPRHGSDGPFLVSLFGKWFHAERPQDRFLLIIAGTRRKTTYEAKQVWRVYPSDVVLGGSEGLVDVFRRFAGVYGLTFTAGSWRGKFLYNERIPSPTGDLKVDFRTEKDVAALHVAMGEALGDHHVVSFGMVIDVTHYAKDVRRHLRRVTRAHRSSH